MFDDTLNSQQPVTFVKEFNDDDVAQFNDDDVAEIFLDTLEKNIKEIYKKFKFTKSMIITMHDKLVDDVAVPYNYITGQGPMGQTLISNANRTEITNSEEE